MGCPDRATAHRVLAAGLTVVLLSSPVVGDESDLRIDLAPALGRPTCVLAAGGSWWLGTEAGLYKVALSTEAGPAGPVTESDRVLVGDVRCLAVHAGVVWAGLDGGSADCGLYCCDQQQPRRVWADEKHVPVRSLRASQSALWVGSPSALASVVGVTPQPPRYGVNVFSLHPDGPCVFAATNYGLLRCQDGGNGDGRDRVAFVPGVVYGALTVGSDLWFGWLGGLSRWPTTGPPTVRLPTAAVGSSSGFGVVTEARPVRGVLLPPAAVGNLRNGLHFLKAGPTLWIGTEVGLFQVRGNGVPFASRLQVGAVNSLTRSEAGGPMWVVGENGVFRLGGADAPNWPARITFDDPTPTKFTGEVIDVTWSIGAYEWRSPRPLVRFRVRVLGADGKPLPNQPAGTGQLPDGVSTTKLGPLPEGSYTAELVAEDIHGHTAQATTGPITVLPRPPEWWKDTLDRTAAIAAAGAAAVLLLISVVAWAALGVPYLLRRYYEAVWGAGHTLWGGPSDLLRAEVKGNGFTVSVVGSPDAIPKAVQLGRGPTTDRPVVLGSGQRPLELSPGSDWELHVEGAEGGVPFSVPWCLEAVGGRLTAGRAAVVVGQRVAGIESPGAQPEPVGPRRDRLRVAALCHGMLGNVEQVARTAKDLGVQTGVICPERATPEHMRQALRGADVVCVDAHGSRKGIRLKGAANRTVLFGGAELRPLKSVRCRLLLLASCNVGAGGLRDSFLEELQRLGINVVAAATAPNERVIRMFMLAVLTNFLTERRAREGKLLAECLRLAAEIVAGDRKLDPAAVTKALDAVVLYGIPKLHVRRT